MKKKILALCAAGLIFSLTGCEETMDPNDPQSVRRYLTKKQIGFTPNQFVSYAVNSDTAKMTLFLQASFEIDQPADNGNNAVAIAANKGNMMVLNYLFDHGAKANVNNGNGEPVIDNAVMMGNKEVVVRILDQLKKEGVEPQNLATAVLLSPQRLARLTCSKCSLTLVLRLKTAARMAICRFIGLSSPVTTTL